MIRQMTGLPANVLGFIASGDVDASDYEEVLIPALEAHLAVYDKARVLYYFGPDFEEFEGDALWDDARVGLKHLTHFEKIAVVSDNKWIRRAIKAFGWLMPGEVQLFNNDQLNKAILWTAD